jgi:hypothetical protein
MRGYFPKMKSFTKGCLTKKVEFHMPSVIQFLLSSPQFLSVEAAISYRNNTFYTRYKEGRYERQPFSFYAVCKTPSILGKEK